MVTWVLLEWCSGVSYLSYSLVGSELFLMFTHGPAKEVLIQLPDDEVIKDFCKMV